MTQTMLLKNVLKRRPMMAYADQYSIQRDDFEMTLSAFALSDIVDKLYKADNQRSTEYWSLRDIIRFISACTTDPNTWLTFLYWKDEKGDMYLIDGGHRLSSLYAWIKRYFVEEQIHDAPKFSPEQKDELRKIRKALGDYADVQKILSSELDELQQAKHNIQNLKMRFVQVMGSPEDARRVFESMNSDTKSLDKNEAYHLSHRDTVLYYLTSACCYLDDNKSTLKQLGSDLDNQMIALGEKIHHLVFQNMLLDTYMTHGKRIGIVYELFNILTEDDPPTQFSSFTKALIKQKIEVARQNFCEVCDGLLHLDSIEHDHIIARSVGGRGDVENGTLLHPYCNRFKADRELEEARADLFG